MEPVAVILATKFECNAQIYKPIVFHFPACSQVLGDFEGKLKYSLG